MSDEAKRRAEIVGARPDVQRWIKRFKRVAKDMPAGVWVFVASGTPTVMAKSDDGHHIEKPTGCGLSVDQDAVIDRTTDGSWDGGDW